jgi:tRNA(Ile)-lysidine synthase
MSEAHRTLQRRVLEHIQTEQLWAPGQTVAVAVSGGVDSTVLLHLLHRTQGAHRGRLSVMSIDHGIRPASAGEAEEVRAQCAVLGLSCAVVSLGLEAGPNLAERARDARRDALRSLGTDRIATGHHEDDQAETVLFHLLRGSGMRGLRGMSARTGPWVRPLLREPRRVLVSWATAEGLNWVEDPSNQASQRGRIRGLMPSLDALHGGSRRALARSARLLAREDAFLTELEDAAWAAAVAGEGLSRQGLSALHPALQLRLLRRLVGVAGVRADPLESVVRGALLHAGTLDLGQGITLVCADGVLKVQRP